MFHVESKQTMDVHTQSKKNAKLTNLRYKESNVQMVSFKKIENIKDQKRKSWQSLVYFQKQWQIEKKSESLCTTASS